MSRLPRSFYTRADVVRIGRDLLGTHIFTRIDGRLTGGMIVETEAYAGPEDRASHAWNNRRTRRTEVMYARGGVAYIYFCYGMHNLFNIVTNREGVPHAVLIRAMEPTHGISTMLRRRHKLKLDRSLTSGPGSVACALGLTTRHSGTDLAGPVVWLERRLRKNTRFDIIASPRVGVDYAGSHAKRPWRFRIRGNPWAGR